MTEAYKSEAKRGCEDKSTGIIHICDSPKRGHLREQAASLQKKAAAKWKTGARKGASDVEVGSIVSVSVDMVDRGKTDYRRVAGVVVEITPHGMFRIAVKGGVLNTCYNRGDLHHQPNSTLDSSSLRESYQNWDTAPRISVRVALQIVSPTGGQGFTRCGCQGICQAMNCKCFKAKVLCNSRCHPSSKACKNCEHS